MKNLFVLATIATVNLMVNGATVNSNIDEKCVSSIFHYYCYLFLTSLLFIQSSAAIKECLLAVHQGYTLCESGDLTCQCNSAKDVANSCYNSCPPSVCNMKSKL